MSKKMKSIIFLIVTLLGFAIYLTSYFLVPIVDQLPFLKYLILFLGYFSIVLFTIGLFNYRKICNNITIY
mgnify:CR=1 FL=1